MPEITTDDLTLVYRDEGPRDGPPVLLLHGWPDDESTWDRVVPAVHTAGLRSIAPTLRGFGRSVFRKPDAPRTGNAAIIAMDVIALMDALAITRFHAVGHDWGSNIAEALAIGWPARIASSVLLSSPPRMGGARTPNFEQAQRYWYQWFQATKRGEAAIREKPKEFAHLMWKNWSPEGWFDEATFERVAQSFEHPDWVDVTLHSYRVRWDEAQPDPRSVWLDDRIKATKQLTLPTLYIQGDADGVNPPSVSAMVGSKFSGPFERVVLPGIGHFPSREAPDDVAALIIQHVTTAFGQQS